jgi:hypothetical protein
MVVCGYTFNAKNLPKTHKPLLSNNLGIYEHAQDWRVRPYSTARDSKPFFTCTVMSAAHKCYSYSFFSSFFLQYVSEGKYELEKCSRGFTLLPREFIGSVLDKVMNGCLGNKGWPHGAITVGEAGAEYSFLGGEAISRCCKYKGFTVHGWLDRHISRELYAGVT